MGIWDSLKNIVSRDTAPPEVREFRDRANHALDEEAKRRGETRTSKDFDIDIKNIAVTDLPPMSTGEYKKKMKK